MPLAAEVDVGAEGCEMACRSGDHSIGGADAGPGTGSALFQPGDILVAAHSTPRFSRGFLGLGAVPLWVGISEEAGKNLSLGPRRCGVQLLLHWELHGHDSLPLLGLQQEARKGLWGLSFATAWALAPRVQRVLNGSLAVPSQLVRFFRTLPLAQ